MYMQDMELMVWARMGDYSSGTDPNSPRSIDVMVELNLALRAVVGRLFGNGYCQTPFIWDFPSTGSSTGLAEEGIDLGEEMSPLGSLFALLHVDRVDGAYATNPARCPIIGEGSFTRRHRRRQTTVRSLLNPASRGGFRMYLEGDILKFLDTHPTTTELKIYTARIPREQFPTENIDAYVPLHLQELVIEKAILNLMRAENNTEAVILASQREAQLTTALDEYAGYAGGESRYRIPRRT